MEGKFPFHGDYKISSDIKRSKFAQRLAVYEVYSLSLSIEMGKHSPSENTLSLTISPPYILNASSVASFANARGSNWDSVIGPFTTILCQPAFCLILRAPSVTISTKLSEIIPLKCTLLNFIKPSLEPTMTCASETA